VARGRGASWGLPQGTASRCSRDRLAYTLCRSCTLQMNSSRGAQTCQAGFLDSVQMFQCLNPLKRKEVQAAWYQS